MSSKAIDKENTTNFTSLTGTKSFGLVNTKSFINNQNNGERLSYTPVLSLEKKALINNVKELTNTVGKPRRALGDVLNTTSNRHKSTGVGITPKFDRTQKADSTPSRDKVVKSFSKLKLNESQMITNEKKETQEEEYPPVERFIGSKYDNFDDLFNDGRLSELFLAPSNTVFNINLNQRKFFDQTEIEEKILISDLEDENDLFEIELKKVNKSLKKMEKKAELKTMTIESLEDLMPKIWEDSFEEN